MRILLVEDNEDHALITELAIRDAQPELAEQLHVDTVYDGDGALNYLRGEGEHLCTPRCAGAARPLSLVSTRSRKAAPIRRHSLSQRASSP